MAKTVIIKVNTNRLGLKGAIRKAIVEGSLGERFKNIILHKAMERLHEDFTKLSEGGTAPGVNDGKPWEPLAASTIAYKKLKGKIKGGRGGKGLLTAAQVRLWKRVYFISLQKSQRKKISGSEARQQAAKDAWSAVIRAGGKTLKSMVGSVQGQPIGETKGGVPGPGPSTYLINVDTGRLKKALKPGSMSPRGTSLYQKKDQKIIKTKQTVSFALEGIDYAKYVLARRPFIPDKGWYETVARESIDEFIKQFPNYEEIS